jgi:LemA protein
MNTRPRWLVPAIIGAVVLVLLFWVIGSYNGLVDKEENVDRAFASIDTELQRRADLIPNAVATVKAALQQELDVFGELARARQNYAGAGSQDEKLEAGAQIDSGLSRLLVIVENYPQLKSNQNLLALQDQLEGSENRIVQARRTYNEDVTEYNKTIRRFPRSIFAGIFGFDRRDLFEAEPADRDVPDVDLDTSSTTTSTTTTSAPAG